MLGMRAVVLDESGVHAVELPRPEVALGEALVRVHACGVNRLDLLIRDGRTAKPRFPHVLGSEAAGVVEASESNLPAAKVGMRVAIAPYLSDHQCEFCLRGEEAICLRGDILGLARDGGYAEYVAVPASALVPLPDEVSYDAAAAVGLATITAWHMLVLRAQLRPGETVLVIGASGGVGSAAVQVAKLAGARVIATAGSADKLRQARELGADATINYREQDYVQKVRALTGKRGVDVVVEHVGEETWEKSVACLARMGRLVTCGSMTGDTGHLNLWSLFAKEISIIGSYGGSRADLTAVLQLVAQGRLRPVIHANYSLERVPEAHNTMEAREHFGKLIVNP